LWTPLVIREKDQPNYNKLGQFQRQKNQLEIKYYTDAVKSVTPPRPISSASALVNKNLKKKFQQKTKISLRPFCSFIHSKPSEPQTARHDPANLEKNKDLGPANPGTKK